MRDQLYSKFRSYEDDGIAELENHRIYMKYMYMRYSHFWQKSHLENLSLSTDISKLDSSKFNRL